MIIISVLGFKFPLLGLFIYPIFISIIFFGFFRGRLWCSSVCPRGAFYDYPVKLLCHAKRMHLLPKSKILKYSILVVMMGFFVYNLYMAIEFSVSSNTLLNRLGMIGVVMCTVTTSVGIMLAAYFHYRAWCVICPMGTFQTLLFRFKSFKMPGWWNW